MMDILASVGEFVCENYEAGLTVGLILLTIALVAQIYVNSSLEADLIELVDRVETLEKAYGAEETEEKEEE